MDNEQLPNGKHQCPIRRIVGGSIRTTYLLNSSDNSMHLHYFCCTNMCSQNTQTEHA